MNLLHANDRRGEHPPSYYAATAGEIESHPALQGDARAEICVIGGGFTGLSAALHLARAGRDVVLLEAQRVGFGASGRNGGQVGSGQRQGQVWLERRYGAPLAHALWDLAEKAKALVHELIETNGIDAAWRPGVAHAAWTGAALEEELAEAEKLHRDYGYDRLELLDEAGAAALTGSGRFTGAVLDNGAAHIHPLRFALGLARQAIAAGARIHEGAEVHHVGAGRPFAVQTGTGRVQADHVILAGNGYLAGLERRLAARVMPINNFIIATEPLGERHREILPTNVAVADSKFVVNYWRLSEERRMIFGGGESYGYRFPADIAALVRPRLLSIYPQLDNARIDHAWGGTLAITPIRMPYLARPAAGLWAAGGYSGHGVALATLAGRILGDAIGGDTAALERFEALDVPAFPGGDALRAPILALAMGWFSLRDRLSIPS